VLLLHVPAGASEAENLCYMERLGLWGTGSAFPSKQEFVGLLKQVRNEPSDKAQTAVPGAAYKFMHLRSNCAERRQCHCFRARL
jgi:hypothetical protein